MLLTAVGSFGTPRESPQVRSRGRVLDDNAAGILFAVCP